MLEGTGVTIEKGASFLLEKVGSAFFADCKFADTGECYDIVKRKAAEPQRRKSELLLGR